jgi:7-keto-8-aminopelargonate synthetase-like enzyme
MQARIVYEGLSAAKTCTISSGPRMPQQRRIECQLRELQVEDCSAGTVVLGPRRSDICSSVVRVRRGRAADLPTEWLDKVGLVVLPQYPDDGDVGALARRGFSQDGCMVVRVLDDCTTFDRRYGPLVPEPDLDVRVCGYDRRAATALDLCSVRGSRAAPLDGDDESAAELVHGSPHDVRETVWLAAKARSSGEVVGRGAIFGAGSTTAFITVAVSGTGDRDAIVEALVRSAVDALRTTGSTVYCLVRHSGDDDGPVGDWFGPTYWFPLFRRHVLKLRASGAEASCSGATPVGHPGMRCTSESPFNIDDIYAGHLIWERDSLVRGTHAGEGKVVDVADGRTMWDFGACSYLGIEKHPALVAKAKEAYDKYGLSTVSSRAYLENPEIPVVEDLVSRKLGGHFLIAPKTHIATNVWATTTVKAEDALVLDREVHVSVQFSTDIAARRGVPKILVPHHDVEAAVWAVKTLAKTHRRVWFCADGLHSMRGELLSTELARAVLGAAPNAYLFIDDSHGIGWTGEHGRGAWLDAFPCNERTVVAVSLCKAVAAGGGGLLFGSLEDRRFSQLAGVPLHWTAPLNAPILAGVAAFFDWIDTPEGVARRASFSKVMRRFNAIMQTEHPDIPLANYAPMPIKNIHAGTLENAVSAVRGLREDGFYACVCSYPVVPKGHAAVRITFSASVPEDVVCVDFVRSLVKHCSGFPPPHQRVRDKAFECAARSVLGDDNHGSSIGGAKPQTTASAPLSGQNALGARVERPRAACVDDRARRIPSEFLTGRTVRTRTGDTVTIEPLTSIEDVMQLSEWYRTDDPLSECLGITQDEWRGVGRAWLGRCVGNGISFVARIDGELAGGLIIEKFTTEAPQMDMTPQMETVMALLGELELPTVDALKGETRDVYRIVFAATSPAHRNRGVLTALGDNIALLGKAVSQGGVVVYASTSSEFSRRASISGGMVEVNTIPYATWRHNGGTPLSAVRRPHSVTSLLRIELPVSWGTWARVAAHASLAACTGLVRGISASLAWRSECRRSVVVAGLRYFEKRDAPALIARIGSSEVVQC